MRLQSDAKATHIAPKASPKVESLGVTAPDRPGSHCFVAPSRNPPNAAWLCRSVRANTQFERSQLRPLPLARFTPKAAAAKLAPKPAAAAAGAQGVGGEGFEPPAIRRGFGGVGSEAAQNAAHGWPGAVGEAGALGRHGARAPRQGSGGMGAAEGTRGNVEAHWAGGAGPAGGPGGSHGSSLAQEACSWPNRGAARGD